MLIVYDTARVGYGQLLEVNWMNIEPTGPGGQFVDQAWGKVRESR